MLVTKRLAVVVTLKCNLQCKLCCNYVTWFKEKPLISYELIKNDIEKSFEIYDKIEWFQFVGGELFLHPELDKIIDYTYNFKNQFDKLIIMTNGGVMPKKEVLDVIAKNPELFEIHVSDYGKLSKHVKDLENAFKGINVKVVVKKFYGDIQYYGGWVDPGDFSSRLYTDSQVKEVFDKCWQIRLMNLHMYDGQIHNCIKSLFGSKLGKIKVGKDEYIDLRDETLSLDKKKEIAKLFNTRPLEACKYCNGFDSETKERHPAAEQI